MFFRIAACVLMMSGVGCSHTANISQWQRGVEHYVYNEANGDLSALRHIGGVEDRTFTVLGTENPDNSNDTVGVLVGHPIVQRQPWAVFVVGNLNRGELAQSRLVALAQREGRLIWRVGETTPAATQAYLRAHSDRAAWPRPANDFNLTVRDAVVRVVERTSGATWELTLPAQPPVGVAVR